MRALAPLAFVLVTAAACGSHEPYLVPSPSELALAATFNPDATGGLRPSTAVRAALFVRPEADKVFVSGTVERAEFEVFGASGQLLARTAQAGPLSFEPDGRVTVYQVLDWEPADVLGRSLTIRLFLRRAPEEGPLPIEYTITF